MKVPCVLSRRDDWDERVNKRATMTGWIETLLGVGWAVSSLFFSLTSGSSCKQRHTLYDLPTRARTYITDTQGDHEQF